MSLVEETLTSYDDYKDRIKELEKAGPSKASVAAKNRVVFLFRQAEEDKELNAGLEGARKKGIKGTLIHVLIKKAEFADPNCPYKTDPKFKVKENLLSWNDGPKFETLSFLLIGP